MQILNFTDRHSHNFDLNSQVLFIFHIPSLGLFNSSSSCLSSFGFFFFLLLEDTSHSSTVSEQKIKNMPHICHGNVVDEVYMQLIHAAELIKGLMDYENLSKV